MLQPYLKASHPPSTMQFTEKHLYHIYNRGNNQQPLFFGRENYILFTKNIRKFISPSADILAWCLMPNHFHLLIHANENTIRTVKEDPIQINALTEGIRLALSSYTKALQKQRGFTGNLFQQKTKSKCICDGDNNYSITAFHYIHQNPFSAGLVERVEEWEFSSLPDYLGIRNGTLINKELASMLMDINHTHLLKETYQTIPAYKLEKIMKAEKK